MKRLYKSLLPVLFVCCSFAASGQQIKTWMCPASSANAYTNTLAANQVMEILSGSFEPDSQVDIIMGQQTLRMGNGGANLSVPFVIAGPAVVVFKKTATGGQGTIISYRISQQQK